MAAAMVLFLKGLVMNFGLNANVLTPPFSALVSMLLIAGIDRIGLRLAHIFNLLGPSAPAWHRWQASVKPLVRRPGVLPLYSLAHQES